MTRWRRKGKGKERGKAKGQGKDKRERRGGKKKGGKKGKEAEEGQRKEAHRHKCPKGGKGHRPTGPCTRNPTHLLSYVQTSSSRKRVLTNRKLCLVVLNFPKEVSTKS